MFFGAQQRASAQDAALFYTIYLFQKAFQDLDMGYASAMAWLLFVIILVITADPGPAQQPVRVLRG